MEQMDIIDSLRYWAKFTPGKAAVRDAGGDIGWAGLDTAAQAGARILADAGVGPGVRVGILMTNSRQFCVSVLAVLCAGGIAVPINTRLHPHEIHEMLADAGATVLLHDESHGQVAADVSTGRPVRSFKPDRSSWSGTGLRVQRTLDDVAVLLYSSGTTGRPKGVAITHANIYAMAHDRIVNDNWSGETRTYVPYSLAFSAGLLASWMATMVAGGMTVVDPAFDPGRALRRFEEDGITVFMAVPAVWQAIADHPDLEGSRVSSLKTVSAGGAMVTPTLMRRLRDRGIKLSQGYGLTESSGVATALRPEDMERKHGSVGTPMMLMQSRIVSADGTDCAPGEVGELWLRGPAVMAGYWRDGAPDPLSKADGWLATGDLASMDEDGYLYIVDRLKDMIITGGLNVFPAEIERVLESLPGVLDCAVVGAPNDRWGETPHAFVVVENDDVTPERLEAGLREHLAGYKIPTHIRTFAGPLPRSANGKIRRQELRAGLCSAPTPHSAV
jgi:fatty-acyl-CoA synthase